MSEEIDAFLRAMVTPRRRQPPRLARCLSGIDEHLVHTPFGRVAAWRIGTGPATLLVHGWEDDNSLWNEQIIALRQRGHAAIAFDLPAHGFSEGDWGMGWEAADAARAVADSFGPVDSIVGHSMGAGAAALAVLEGLQVKCAIFDRGRLPSARREPLATERRTSGSLVRNSRCRKTHLRAARGTRPSDKL